MTFNGWLQIALYCVLIIAAHQAVRRLHDARVQRRAHVPVAGAAPARARHLPRCAASTRTRNSTGSAYAIAMLAFSIAGFVVAVRDCSGCRACCRSIRRARPRCRPTSRSTPRSASSPTPTGSPTCRETTMSYLTQMAGLTVHNFVSAATGIALAIALVRGFARRSAQDDRQFLGRSDPLHALHPAADLDRRRPGLRLAGHAAEPQRLHRGDDAGRRQAGHRAGPGGFAGSHQDAGHQRRRLLQRQLGASVREPERAHQPRSRCC